MWTSTEGDGGWGMDILDEFIRPTERSGGRFNVRSPLRVTQMDIDALARCCLIHHHFMVPQSMNLL
jgi:hypothetical protein